MKRAVGRLYRPICMLLSYVLVLAACTDEKKPAQQYGTAMVQNYKNIQKFEKKVDLQQTQTSVR